MNRSWINAVFGGTIGASVAVAIVFGAASLGYFPQPSDRQFHAYLMSHPSIVLAMAEKAQIEQTETEQLQLQDAVNKIGLRTYFNPKVAFVAGPPDAKKTLVEFFDYNCAHCINTYPLVKKYLAERSKDTRFAFIELPIFGEASENAARAAIAARRQPDKYITFHFALMSEQGVPGADQIVDAAHKAGLDVDSLMNDLKDSAINKELAAAHALAARTGIKGTPFFIINGKPHEGELSESDLKTLSPG